MNFDRLGSIDLDVLFDDQNGSVLGFEAMMDRVLEQKKVEDRKPGPRYRPPNRKNNKKLSEALVRYRNAQSLVRKYRREKRPELLEKWEAKEAKRRKVYEVLKNEFDSKTKENR